MPLPLFNIEIKDYGIPAALRHPLIKNLKVGEKAGKAAVRRKPFESISTLTPTLSRQQERALYLVFS